MSKNYSKKNILKLFERPKELSIMPKGTDDTVFDVPDSYLPDDYRAFGNNLSTRFGEEANGGRIPVKVISIPPLGDILSLKRDQNFTLLLPQHRRIAAHLITIYMGMQNVDDLLSVAVYTRDRVNPYLFNYALSVALLHRTDTQDLDLPSFVHSFPDKFVDSKIIGKVREQANILPNGARPPIVFPKDFTASDLELEHRLAYFREDIGINLHHWHWHLVYPIDGPIEIVNKNRRGELFYYMHQQVIARYNFERFCNGLQQVERLIEWRKEIPEAYFPKLESTIANRSWPGRVSNQKMSNIRRESENVVVDIDDLERWRDRIFNAINSGSYQNSNGKISQLTEADGINVLGNMIEASILSPDHKFYGDLHNMGHVILSYIHDPDHRHLESSGVMGDLATSMRDPVFYRWHAYIDYMFRQYKSTLPRYTVEQLNFLGVSVEDFYVKTGQQMNILNTHWQLSDVDLSRGMDFQPRGPIFVRFTHLNHFPFEYNILIKNNGPRRQGTCRIFMAPKFDERGNSWLFKDQRQMFIELDKFAITLKQGQTCLSRQSTRSSVTIPFERTFRDLDSYRPAGGDKLETFNFCGCGWPEHMLIPKGNSDKLGMPCELFIMISNYEDDKVQQDISGRCNDAYSYCGVRDQLYPDRRAMGFPFDREPRKDVNTLQEFLTKNMRVANVFVHFSDEVKKRRPT